MAENVEFEIKANVDDAIRSVKSLESSAEKSVASISNAFGKLKVVAGAALAFLAGREVFNFFEESIKLAAESDAQFAKLEASLKSLGEFTPQLVEDFGKFADELEQNSKFSDDAAIGLLAVAKQMGRTDEQAKKLVQTAADLASITGDTLESSFNELSNTLLGQSKALSKTIPEVKAFTEAQLKSGAAVDLVADRLKGASKNAIQTYGGAIAQLENASEDLRKEIGKLITQNPVLVETIKTVTAGFGEVIESVTDNSDSLKAYIANIVKLSINVIPALLDTLEFVIRAFEGVGLAISLSETAFHDLQLAINDIQKTVVKFVTGGIESLVNGLGDVIASIGKFVKSISEIPGADVVFKGMGIDVKEFGDSLVNTSKDLKEFKTDIKVFDIARDEILKAREESVAFGDTVEATFGATADGVNKFSSAIKETAKKIQDADSDIAKEAKKAATAQEVAAQAAIKASVDAARQKAKALADEKEHGADRKKLAEDAKKFAEDLANKEISERQKVQVLLEKNLEEIQGFENKKVISTEEAQRLRNVAIQNSENQYVEITRKATEEVEKFKDSIFSKETGNLQKIELERDRNLAKLKEFEDQKTIATKEAEDLRAAIIADAEEKTFKSRVEANQKYADTVSNFVNNGLKGLATSAVSLAVDTIAPGFGKAAGEIFNFLAQDAEKFGEMLDNLFSVEFLENISKNLLTLVEKLPGLVANLAKFIAENAGTIIEGLIGAVISNIPEIISALVKAFTDPKFHESLALGIANGVANGLKNMAGDVSRAFKVGIKDSSAELKRFASNSFFTGISNGFDNFIKGSTKAFNDFGNQLKISFAAGFDGIKDAISRLGEFLSPIFNNSFVQGIKNGLADLQDSLTTIFTTSAAGIKDALADLSQSANQAGTDFSNSLKEGASYLSEKVNAGKDAVVGAVSQLGDFAQKTGGFLSDSFKSFLSNIENSQFVQNIKTGLSAVGDAAASLGGKASDGFKAGIASVSDFFTGLGGNIANGFKETLANVTSEAKSFGGNISEGFKTGFANAIDAFKKSGGIANDFADGFVTAIKTAGGKIAEEFKAIFIKGFSDAGGNIAIEFKNIFGKGFEDAGGRIAEEFKNIFREAGKAIKDIFSFDIGGGGGSTGAVGKALGIKGLPFATGGVVPSGFPNDTFPARLTSGELVVPKDLVGNLESFLNAQSRGPVSSDAEGAQLALLNKIANLLAQPTQVQTTAEVDGRALANIILNLSRNNARLAV